MMSVDLLLMLLKMGSLSLYVPDQKSTLQSPDAASGLVLCPFHRSVTDTYRLIGPLLEILSLTQGCRRGRQFLRCAAVGYGGRHKTRRERRWPLVTTKECACGREQGTCAFRLYPFLLLALCYRTLALIKRRDCLKVECIFFSPCGVFAWFLPNPVKTRIDSEHLLPHSCFH